MRKLFIIFGWLGLVAAGATVYLVKPDFSKLTDWFYKTLPQVPIESILRQPINDIIKKVSTPTAKVSAPPPLRSTTTAKTSTTLSAQGTITETNRQRALNGNLPALTENSRLTAAATVKVEDMFAKQYFEHVSPSGAGPSDLANNAGYEYILIGENLALGIFAGDKGLVEAWMNSPGHRANILNPKYTEIGVAMRKGMFEGDNVWLAVQEFGRPLSSCPRVNEQLKAGIEYNQNRISVLGIELETRKQDIENHSPKRGSEYNRKIDEYNALVEQYNSLIEVTKGMISEYNSQVEAFNACAQS